MQGIVFTHLCDMLEEAGGIGLLQRVLDKASLGDMPFVATDTYCDTLMHAILGAACAELGQSAEALLRDFGRYLFSRFAQRYEAMILEFDNLKDFLLHIDSVIHLEVSKLYPQSSLPMFDFEDHDDTGLLMIYQSPRKLCFLAEGLIEGASHYYRQPIRLQQQRCMHEGAPCCDLRVDFLEH